MTGKTGGRLLLVAIGALAASLLGGLPSLAQPTPAGSASAQPSLPKPLDGSIPATSPIIGGASGGQTREAPAAAPRATRRAASSHAARHAGVRHRFRSYGQPLERPALAGVELVAPIPVPVQPPHFTVPTPVYALDNIATFYTTPLPPVVCHRVPRDPYAPDPHLIRETTVLCEADNP